MKTSTKISKDQEYKDSVFYTAHCSCGDENHTHSIILEYDGELPDMISMVLYSKVEFHLHREASFWKRIWNRWKYSLRILFLGRLEWDEAFLFQGEKQIEDYIGALKEGLVRVKKAKKKASSKSKKGKKRENGKRKKQDR